MDGSAVGDGVLDERGLFDCPSETFLVGFPLHQWTRTSEPTTSNLRIRGVQLRLFHEGATTYTDQRLTLQLVRARSQFHIAPTGQYRAVTIGTSSWTRCNKD